LEKQADILGEQFEKGGGGEEEGERGQRMKSMGAKR